MSFKEISVLDINKYKDSISLFKDWAITVVEDNEKVNPMTIGWGGLGVLWRKPCLTVYIHKERYSKHMFDNANSFSVCFFDMNKYKNELSYFGTISGKDEDKIEKSKLTVKESDGVKYIDEADMVIICNKMGQSDFDVNNVFEESIKKWYNESGVHTIYYGEIKKVLLKDKQ